ncbi:MAG: hypothetical protein IT379_31255 [Deltaproteobacteria bacterium]|nr:hypothetical protein [Deltaproteobacteria bacterium]
MLIERGDMQWVRFAVRHAATPLLMPLQLPDVACFVHHATTRNELRVAMLQAACEMLRESRLRVNNKPSRILARFAAGLGPKAIRAELRLSRQTYTKHVRALLDAVELPDVPELFALMLRRAYREHCDCVPCGEGPAVSVENPIDHAPPLRVTAKNRRGIPSETRKDTAG